MCWQVTIAGLMQKFQYDLRCPAWTQPLQCDRQRLQNTTKLRAPASEIAAPKPNLDAKAQKKDFEAVFKSDFKRKITSTKSKPEPCCTHSNTQPFQYSHSKIKKCISCETSLKKWKCKMWKRSFRARPPSKSKSARCENEAFVRDLPEKSESSRCENKAFVRDLLQKANVEDVKTKLSCETSFKDWKCKMWKKSFRARPPSKNESGRCENKAFVRDFFQILKVQDAKTKLSCGTSFKFGKFKWWKWSLNCQLQCGADLRIIPV